ncbi:MAG: LysM peptidoglycan-binding domain-containing protein, partial [Propionibacterium sp.]
MKRLSVSVGALLVLIALLPGGAWALVHWGRLDLLGHLDLHAFVGHSDGGAVLLVLFTAVGWGAWLLLAASVSGEVARAVSGGRIRWRPPGDGVFGPAAAVLVTCVAGLAAVGGQTPGEEPGSADTTPPATATELDPGGDASDAAVDPGPRHGARWHTVAQGDDLWTLAERYCGDGSRWREILEANATSVLSPLQPLAPGTLLEIPASWPEQQTGPGSDQRSDAPVRLLNATRSAPEMVIVQPGDSLWQLAQQHLADGGRWPAIQQENAALVPDPDLIIPGQELRLPARADKPVTASAVPGAAVEASPEIGGGAADPQPPLTDPEAVPGAEATTAAEAIAGPAEESHAPARRLELLP